MRIANLFFNARDSRILRHHADENAEDFVALLDGDDEFGLRLFGADGGRNLRFFRQIRYEMGPRDYRLYLRRKIGGFNKF